MRDSRFTIRADLIRLLCGSLQSWCRERNSPASPRLVLKLFNGENVGSFFDEFGWDIEFDGHTGDIVAIHYRNPPASHTMPTTTYNFFKQIAPFVDAGCYIEMVCTYGGDDFADIWRWYFDGKSVERQDGTVVYRVEKCPLELHGCKNCVFSLLCLSGQEPPISAGECCRCEKKVFFQKEKRAIIPLYK